MIKFFRFYEGLRMKLQRLYLLPAAAFMVLMICVPRSVLATSITITVDPNSSTCVTTSNPPCYKSIQSAIDAAVSLASANPSNSYSVMVEPGTYPGGITLKTGIPVFGRETARTIIDYSSGTAATAAVTVNNVTGVSFRNFTLINALIGISVTGNATVSITNNVFQVGTTGTAVQIQSAPSAESINNTFYLNGTAIVRDSDSIKIINNIFSSNTTNINQGSLSSEANISYNCFNPTPTASEHKGSNYIPNATFTNPNPLFVDPSQRDFHLKESSPSIDNGDPSKSDPSLIPPQVTNPSDIGAYGGPNADTIPFPVSGVSVTGTTATSISLSWQSNNSYLVTNTTTPGGYKVYYSLNASGAPYQNVPGLNAGASTSATVSGLSSTPSTPSAPTLTSVGFANETLKLSWSSISGATGYTIYYIDNDTLPSTEQSLDVHNTTSHNLTGLINYHHYSLAVTAYTQNTYYFAVTAYDSTSQPQDPGVQHESHYSTEVIVPLGLPAESAKVYDPSTYFPEPITPFPNLPNKGCFIATAAYGYYSAPQVQALREFRDKYLTTNTPGRAFVRWYYAYGPTAAQFINEHPGLKPAVRVALLPAVGGAMFMTRTSTLTKTILFVVLGLLAFYESLRAMKTRRT